MNFQKVLICGNITKQPEIRYTPSGTAVCTFSVATNENYTKSNGEKEQVTQFHFIKTFGKLAENCNQYLIKGQNVLIEGTIDYQEWTNKDGTKGKRTEIKAISVKFGRKPQTKTEPQDNAEPPEMGLDEALAGPDGDNIPF